MTARVAGTFFFFIVPAQVDWQSHMRKRSFFYVLRRMRYRIRLLSYKAARPDWERPNENDYTFDDYACMMKKLLRVMRCVSVILFERVQRA